MLLAITAQRAHVLGFLAEGNTQWRVWRQRFVGKLAGGVATNVFVRDLDLDVHNAGDARRLEVVADGLLLFGGAQLAVDTTLVSVLRGDGSARTGAARRDGVALAAARRAKERRYPELVRRRARARLVVLAVEGRWSPETQKFLSLLARARARAEGWLLRRRAEMAWRLRWGSLLACSVARAVATSLLELPQASLADGETPAMRSEGSGRSPQVMARQLD